MKKLRILLLVLVAATAFQSASGQGFSLGVKAGLNFANVNTSSAGAAYDSRTGYHVGAYAMFKFSKLAIQPELVFSQQGTTVKTGGQSFDQNFSYVNIPILLKLYLVGGLNLQAGPQFGFLTAAEGPSGSIKDQLKSSDTSVGLGVGWDLPLRLNATVRYNMGLSDNNNSGSTAEVKNQVWQISAGFRLLGK